MRKVVRTYQGFQAREYQEIHQSRDQDRNGVIRMGSRVASATSIHGYQILDTRSGLGQNLGALQTEPLAWNQSNILHPAPSQAWSYNLGVMLMLPAHGSQECLHGQRLGATIYGIHVTIFSLNNVCLNIILQPQSEPLMLTILLQMHLKVPRN